MFNFFFGSRNTENITINVTFTSDLVMGICPSEEQQKEANTPKPWIGRITIIPEKNPNDTQITKTNSSGRVSLSLLSGKHFIILDMDSSVHDNGKTSFTVTPGVKTINVNVHIPRNNSSYNIPAFCGGD